MNTKFPHFLVLAFIFAAAVLLIGSPAGNHSSSVSGTAHSMVTSNPTITKIKLETYNSGTLGIGSGYITIAEWTTSGGTNMGYNVWVNYNPNSGLVTLSYVGTTVKLSNVYIQIYDQNGNARNKLSQENVLEIQGGDTWDLVPTTSYSTTSTLSTSLSWSLYETGGGPGGFFTSGPSFPSFPSLTYSIAGTSFSVPNLLAIPAWIGEIFLWMFDEIFYLIGTGWETLWIDLSGAGSSVFTSVINFLVKMFSIMVTVTLKVADSTGILSPIVAAFLFGIELLLLVIIAYAVVKILIYVVELA